MSGKFDSIAECVRAFDFTIPHCNIALKSLSAAEQTQIVYLLREKTDRVLGGVYRVIYYSGVAVHLIDYVFWDGKRSDFDCFSLFHSKKDAQERLDQIAQLNTAMGFCNSLQTDLPLSQTPLSLQTPRS